MPLRSRAFARQKLCLDFASLKHANLKGLYVAPVPEEPLLWTGVLFVRKGPYTNAILRFQISFPETYPDRAPTVTFQQDVFHPLVTPLTTYTHSTRERGGGTLSAADEEKLPPGGLVLSGAFPEWFGQHIGRDGEEVGQQDESEAEGKNTGTPPSPPHIASLLHFLRLAFTVPEILDEVPLALAANPSAWHAWRSHRAKVLGEQAFSPAKSGGAGAGSASEGSGSGEGSTSPRGAAQPGGARRPGEWNWSGVWEDRVRKVVNASRAEGTLFGGEGGEVISFTKMDEEALASIMPQVEAQAQVAS